MNSLVIYKSKYGATQQYAAWLGKELNLPVKASTECNDTDLAKADFLVLGTSVYIGKLIINEWIKANLAAISGKKIYLFVVCGTPADETVKLESYVASSIPAGLRKNCGIYFLPGRLLFKKLSWLDKFLLRIGYLLSPKKQKEDMHISDYDSVKKENLSELINAIKEELLTKEKSNAVL
jgi:menaquinone-dependent protoporphyrinogen IX oxidase